MDGMKKTANQSTRRTQGMNWIRPVKRLAIYLRDGLACVWCNATIEDGIILTLDHLTAYSKGGSNDATNLVTCCSRCNSSRGTRGITAFAHVVAAYLNHGVKPATILARIALVRRRVLDIQGAKELMERRGGFVKAVRKGL